MRLPEIAARLHVIATDSNMPELAMLAQQIGRRRPRKIAEPRSAPVTPDLIDRIRDYAAQNPRMSQLEIGRHFNVNQGRASEALRGKRK